MNPQTWYKASSGDCINTDIHQKPARTDSIKDQNLIFPALNWIDFDLNRPVNADG